MYENLIEHIVAAEKEAIKDNIKANMLIIGEGLALSNGFLIKSYGTIKEIPPMVLGLKTIYAKQDEMPDDTSFMLTYSSQFEEAQRKEIALDIFSDRLGINLVTLSLLEQKREIYFVDKDGEIKNAIIDSIDIINHTIIAHEPSVNRFRVRKYECRKFTFEKYGKEFSLAKEELEC